MRAVVAEASGVVGVAQVEEPQGRASSIVRVEFGGLCGTDYKVLHGEVPVQFPLVLGHEVVGRIEVAGEDSNLAPGTRVLVDPNLFCGTCDRCRRSLEHLCGHGGLMGRDFDGGLTERIAVPAPRLHPIPDEVDDDDAALLQVLGTCVHAQRLVATFPVDTAVVFGLGVSGLLHVQLLRARGVRTIVGVSRSEDKRALALGFGAAAAVVPAEAGVAVRDLTAGRGADIVIEAVGRSDTIAAAVDLTAAGGAVLVFGTATSDEGELPYYTMYHRELRLVNSRGARPVDYDDAIALVAGGAVQGSPLVSHRLPLESAAAVFERWNVDDQRLKVVLQLGAS